MEIPGYEIIRELGQGGMATVYLGRQLNFDRRVAIKVMAPAYVSDPTYAQRFLREAKIVAGLSHPHIVPVYDVGVVGEYHYMAMEYLNGNLSEWMKAGLEEREIVKITKEIGRALHYASGKGYVHRDIKPDNIMFREDTSAVLTDFGIARPQVTDEQYTMAGTVVGTPKYMAPEQARGIEIDGRADVYALGCVFYEMLTGKVPYDGSDPMAIGISHIRDPIPELPPKWAKFQDFLEKILAKDPDDRFQNGLEAVKFLEAMEEAESSGASQSIPAGHTPPPQPAAEPPSPGLSLMDKPLAPLQTPTKIDCQEHVVKKMLSRKYELECIIVTEDSAQLAVQFSSITTKIMEWYDARQAKAAGVIFNITTSSDVSDKAQTLVTNLVNTGEPFDFLQKMPVTLNLFGGDGTPVGSWKYGKH